MGQYRFDTWTTDNGLPQNGVRQVSQTPEGYLWFTTFDGLVRFDGLAFTTFNKSNTKGIINNRFTGLFVDDDGTIYSHTMDDGVLTAYRNGEFSSYDSTTVPGRFVNWVEKDPAGYVKFLTDDDDRKGRSWYRLVDDKFEFLEKLEAPNNGHVVYGKSGKTWTIYQDKVIESRNGVDFSLPIDLKTLSLHIRAFEDRSGALWLGETKVYRIKDGVMKVFSEADGLPENSYYHSFWDEPDGSVWFASGGNSSVSVGLVQYKDNRLKLWGQEHGLTATMISNVFVDREGTPWLGTDRGLVRRRKQIIQTYSKADGLDHNEIYPILKKRDGSIWIGSIKGLTVYSNGKFEQLILQSEPKSTGQAQWKNGRAFVQSLWEAPNGKVWVGVSGALFIVDKGVAKSVANDGHFFSIQADDRGNVWAASTRGIFRFVDEKVVEHFMVKDGLPSDNVTTIFQDSKKQLWFGSYGGLTRFDNGRFINYSTKDGLVGNYVRTIYEDAEGTLWIGTYDQGMSRYRDGQFFNYNEENGLFNNGVFAIREDSNGFFWISSNRGIYRVSKSELNQLAEGSIAKINSVGYGKEDGMLSNECNGGRQPSSLVDDQGRFWFPTQDGVAIVDPKAETTNSQAPAVVIESLIADREPVDLRDGATIAPGVRDLEIKYTGISLIKSDQVKFQYKLDGRDTDWIDAGTRRTAYYSNLAPGDYKFNVRAANSDGVWNETGVSVGLTLTPYFYQTRLFALLVVLGAAILLLLVWKISVKQLESRERKLTRLVAARTEELAEANRVLQDLANSDGLTKIGNRRRFESFLGDEWHLFFRFRTPI
ncbi:MAG TPA: two-component regulator propeller domain-containing protein [Pyrinomonadaceae bacterium]|nr:two-component regulator propeller domain-containing protein [Pyrinomonadaceae bacterium]